MIRDIAKKIKRLLGYAQDVKWHLAAAILGSSVAGLIGTWMMADFLGNATLAFTNNDTTELWRALSVAILWLALILLLRAVVAWLTGMVNASMVAAMRGHLMDIMLSLPLKDSNSSHSGMKLSYYTNDIPTATSSVFKTLSIPVEALISGLFCFLYVISVHWVMAVISLAIGTLTYVYSILFAGRLHRIALKMQQFKGILEIRIKTLLDGMVTARMYGMRGKLENEMKDASEDLMKSGISWAWTSGFLGGMNNVQHRLSINLLTFAAGWLFLGSVIQLPELMRVSHMAAGVIGVFGISRALVEIQKSLAGCERIFDYIDSAQKETGGVSDKRELSGTVIDFKDVIFGYEDGIPVIKNLSFNARKGEVVALVGRSGNGKSTVLRLVQGLYAKESGQITIAGVPVEEWELTALRKFTALVPQDPVLFPGTIASNIAFGCDTADMEMIKRAAKDAGAHEFINDMPKGYETIVAERGNSLSGGQRQRISIARALYRGSLVLLLDEPTSAMDSESEAVIYETLRKFKGEKTILFVTHKTSALSIADKTVVI